MSNYVLPKFVKYIRNDHLNNDSRLSFVNLVTFRNSN